MNTTLRTQLDFFTEETSETVQTIVFGDIPTKWLPFDLELGEILQVDQISSVIMDRVFDNSYGIIESPTFCGWSDNFVVFNDDYDGAEDVCWVPRNPQNHYPQRPGGPGY